MRTVRPKRVLAACLLAVCVALLEANSAQQPSPSAPAQAPVAPDTSSTKTLRFLAIDHDGNPITGLRVEDLSLRISGQSRKIVSLSPAATQSLDIGIFFDISGSRRSDQLIPQEVQATSRFLESIWSPGDFGFAVAFGEIPVTLTKPTQYLQEIEEGLQKIPGATYRGSTAIYDALASVHVTGKPSGRGEKLFIVVGDFEDNSSHKSEDKTIETLRDEGIRIFPLLRMENDVYSSRYRHHANEIAKKFARSTGGDILVVSNQKDLDNAFRRITNELRSSYRLTYEPLPNEGELKKIQIKSSRPNLELFFPHD